VGSGGYQDFEDTVDGGATVSAEIMPDRFPARALLIERLTFAGREFNRIGGEDDIRGECTAGFYK